MAADEISVKYEEMEQVAAKFSQNGQSVTQLLQELQRPYQALKDGGWIGHGADAFFAEMEEKVLPALKRLAEALTQAGSATNDICQTMQSADEEASSGFRSDGSGGAGAGAGAGAGGLGATGSGGGSGGGLGSGLGGGLGGSMGSSGSGGGGIPSGFGSPGVLPQTNLGAVGRGFDLFGGMGRGEGAGASGSTAGNFRYQPVAGVGSLLGGSASGLAFGPVGGILGGLAGGAAGMPLLMAVASPFVAMLGKTIKNKIANS